MQWQPGKPTARTKDLAVGARGRGRGCVVFSVEGGGVSLGSGTHPATSTVVLEAPMPAAH